MRLAACAYPGGIYVSTDAGATWNLVGPSKSWTGITCSNDGLRLAATASDEPIHISEDGGATWRTEDEPRQWGAITCSIDGKHLYATVGSMGGPSGPIYRSPSGTTRHGTAGFLYSSVPGAIELQYTGNGIFMPLSHEGVFECH